MAESSERITGWRCFKCGGLWETRLNFDTGAYLVGGPATCQTKDKCRSIVLGIYSPRVDAEVKDTTP